MTGEGQTSSPSAARLSYLVGFTLCKQNVWPTNTNEWSESGKGATSGSTNRLPTTRRTCPIFSVDTSCFSPPYRPGKPVQYIESIQQRHRWRLFRFATLSRPSKPVRYAVAIESGRQELIRAPHATQLGQARSMSCASPAPFKLDDTALAFCISASKPTEIRHVNSESSVGC